MAQVIPQGIYLGGANEICSISVNGGEVLGEGGPLRPQLVMPVKFEMRQQPKDAQITLTSFIASLGTAQHASPAQLICQPVTQQLTNRFPATSQTYAYEHIEYVRFFLSAVEVEDVEARRHAANSDVFTMWLKFDVAVAGLRSHNNDDELPWNPQFGTISEVFPFWAAQPQPLQINVEQSSWVNNVLPGLGYDQLRLIELKFPPPLPDHDNAASQFDKAKRALDERRYDDCIKECRGLLKMWEKQFGATEKYPVADVIARDRHWAAGDDRRDLIYALWQRVSKVVSAPHHSENPVIKTFDRRDARLVLILLAALSEYV
ncbi:MAG: hypothetical protein ACYC1I_04285 [Acidimicrobiales bacterium]|nr:hypothetical protein [Acidimicrobiales bacterium]